MPPAPQKSAFLVAAILTGALVHPAVAGEPAANLKCGALLVTVGGCADCHMPSRNGANGPEKDLARGLSGHPESLRLPPPPRLEGEWNWAGSATMTAFVGPWGVTYAANLTPDRETGIGAWTANDFIRAMRTGQHVGVGRPILPPMPWQALASLPERDLRAIHAYLMAQPAVNNRVPDYAPPAPATARSGGPRNPG